MAISLLLLARGRATQPSFADNRYGYGTSGGHRAVSAGLSLVIVGGVGAALVTALVAPELVRVPTVITGSNIPIPRPVDPVVELQPQTPQPPSITRFTLPQPRVEFPPLGNPPVGEPDTGYVPPPGPEIGAGTGGGTGIDVIPVPAPIFREATRDPRFARSFQPAYPPALEREGVPGTAQVRVRIGPDGEVISVENLASTHPDFFAATQRQALRHWRFRPATRDGVPVETTLVLTVRFQVPPPD